MICEYSPLLDHEIEELIPVLHTESVYKHIGGMPSKANFTLGLSRSLAGPPKDAMGEQWINIGVRKSDSGELIGRLEATIHGGIAEVAFLYGSKFWNQGFATHGLLWLHKYLHKNHEVTTMWATVHPNNLRSVALLRRCEYVETISFSPTALYTYDDGDLVFRFDVIQH